MTAAPKSDTRAAERSAMKPEERADQPAEKPPEKTAAKPAEKAQGRLLPWDSPAPAADERPGKPASDPADQGS